MLLNERNKGLCKTNLIKMVIITTIVVLLISRAYPYYMPIHIRVSYIYCKRKQINVHFRNKTTD